MHNFEQLYDFFSVQLEQERDSISARKPENLYQPVVFTLDMGGKRLRPVLLLMAHELFSNEIENALPVAFAIEMFHNFTLLHDDIMDGAHLRRNHPTIHVKYSNNIAILSGDAMSILSYEYINQCKSPNYREIFELFTQTALKICEGQQYDMDFETRDDVSVDEYLYMIGLKTAILIAASLKLGALIANAPESDACYLYDFGYNLGMAFQIQDDLLDTFGTTSDFGKRIGGDIISNKKTFLMLKALELAKSRQLEELKHLTSSTNFDAEKKIKKVKSIFNELQIDSVAKAKMEEYYQLALQALNDVNISNDRKHELLHIASRMMKRTS